MENKPQHTPDISGLSEDMQKSISSKLQRKTIEEHRFLLDNRHVAISISDNEELEELGFSNIHLRDLMIELVRHLLINGATIVYGGNLDKEGYTYLFADLALQYQSINMERYFRFVNYFAYPIYNLLTEDDEVYLKQHGTRVIKVPYQGTAVIEADKYLNPDTLQNKLIWASSLTGMRSKMITESSARILVGGKVGKYSGKMPGIIEEAKITLKQAKPLYLVGALGGASRQVIDALEGKAFSYPGSDFHQTDEYREFKEAYNKQHEEKIDANADAAFFQLIGVSGLAKINGLTEEENRLLFHSSNLPEIIFYIFKGLKNTANMLT